MTVDRKKLAAWALGLIFCLAVWAATILIILTATGVIG
jgi:hypothetical protein